MVFAADELVYGPEWTFTNPSLLNGDFYDTPTKESILDVYHRHVVNLCAGGLCKITHTEESFTIDFSNGLKVNIGFDIGVVEVQATPQTSKQWKKNEKLIQKVIFDGFADIGLVPHEREGAGHLNVGLKYFLKNPKLFLNFIVDFYNHEGVGIVLNSQVDNQRDAPYLSQQYKSETERLDNEIKIKEALANIESSKSKNFYFILKNLGPFFQTKWKALGLREAGYLTKTISELSRFEIRTLRPQASMKDFNKVIEIYEARIKYLEKIKESIVLKPVQVITDGWVALGQFADYLEESGLKVKDYKSLMPALWRDLPESDYIRSPNKCIKLF